MRTLSYIITCTSCIHVHVYTSCYRHVYMLEETTTSLSEEGNLEQSISWLFLASRRSWGKRRTANPLKILMAHETTFSLHVHVYIRLLL